MFVQKLKKSVICFLAIFAYPPLKTAIRKIGIFLAAGLLLNLINDEAVSYLLLLILIPSLIALKVKGERA